LVHNIRNCWNRNVISYTLHSVILQAKVCAVAPTGVAAFNIEGTTLHSLLSLPTRGEFKDLEGEQLN